MGKSHRNRASANYGTKASAAVQRNHHQHPGHRARRLPLAVPWPVCAARATVDEASRRASRRICLWVITMVRSPRSEVGAGEAYVEIGDKPTERCPLRFLVKKSVCCPTQSGKTSRIVSHFAEPACEHVIIAEHGRDLPRQR